MSIEITAEEAKAKLAPISPIIGKSALLPIFSSFCFTGKHVYGWNDEIGIRTEFPEGINASVLHSPMFDIISGLDGKIKLDESEKSVVMTRGKSKWKFEAGPPDDFVIDWPEELALDPKTVKMKDVAFGFVPSKKIQKHIRDLLPVLGRADVSETLSCIHVVVEGEVTEEREVCLVASDDSRYLEVDISGSDDLLFTGESLLMPLPFARGIVHLCDATKDDKGKAWASVHEGVIWWFASIGGYEVMARGAAVSPEAAADIPDIRGVSKQVCKTKTLPIPENVKAAINRADVVAGTWDNWVSLKGTGKRFLIGQKDTMSIGAGEDVVDWKIAIGDKKNPVFAGIDYLVWLTEFGNMGYMDMENNGALVAITEDSLALIATVSDPSLGVSVE